MNAKTIWKLTKKQEEIIAEDRMDFESLFGQCFIERLSTYEGGGFNIYYPEFRKKTPPIEWCANIDELCGWLRGAVKSQEIIKRYREEQVKKKQ